MVAACSADTHLEESKVASEDTSVKIAETKVSAISGFGLLYFHINLLCSSAGGKHVPV